MKTENQPSSKEVTARVKAFSSEGAREYRLLVSTDGSVRVWDSIAGHFTTCHAMSVADSRRIRVAAEILRKQATSSGRKNNAR